MNAKGTGRYQIYIVQYARPASLLYNNSTRSYQDTGTSHLQDCSFRTAKK